MRRQQIAATADLLSKANVAKALFRFLESQGVAYCVMGDSRACLEHVTSDIDIVVPHQLLPSMAERLQRFCAEQNLLLVQFIRHKQETATCFVLAWLDAKGAWNFLSPDISSDFWHKGRLLLAADELLAKRILALDRNGEGKGFYVAAPADEFIYYCLKKVCKLSLSNLQGSHLNAQWAKDPENATAQLRRFWPSPHAAILHEAAQNNDWASVRAALPRLLSEIEHRFSAALHSGPREFFRKVQRVLYPTGLSVAFLGPDGSGKSSVINALMPALTAVFPKGERMHFRPGTVARRNGPPVVDPHGEAPRGSFTSTLKIFYFCLDYWLGYLHRVKPQLVRSSLIVFDRYYHDLLVDPKRYRYGAQLWLARLVGKLIPEPDLWILLDAPTEILQARKQEVTVAETQRQRGAYRELVLSLPNGVVIDASKSLEETTAEVIRTILRRMADRTHRRLSP